MELKYLLGKVDSALVNACKDDVLMWIYILVGIEREVKQEGKLAVEYVSWYGGLEFGGTQCLETEETFLIIPLFPVSFPSSTNFIKPLKCYKA